MKYARESISVHFIGRVEIAEHIAKRRLIRVLEDWTPPFPGFYMYYPSRQHQPAALAALISALRFS